MITKEVTYTRDNQTFIGYVAYHESHKPKPCVLIGHDWAGRGPNALAKAEQIAELGYVGFALDMYGNATVGETLEQRRALIQPFFDRRPLVTERVLAGFEKASHLSFVNPHKIAMIGFCFGGLCALDLARSGSDVRGVVSFHGLLNAPEPTVCQKIKAKVLVLHGFDDPMATPAQVMSFTQEMNLKKANWEIDMYGHTKHSFSTPGAHNEELGLQYDEQADSRSWSRAINFFEEIFK